MTTNPADSEGSKDPLDQWLQSGVETIPNHDFTERVLLALPRRRRVSRRSVILLACSILGGLLAVQWVLWNDGAAVAAHSLAQWPAAIISFAAVALSLARCTFDAIAGERDLSL